LKIAIKSPSTEACEAIRQLLSPWKVTFTNLDEAEIAVTYQENPPENIESIIIPSDSPSFKRWLKDRGLKITTEQGSKTTITATPKTNLTITPKKQYCYKRSTRTVSTLNPSPYVKLSDGVLLMTLDVIEEHARIIDKVLNPKLSTFYRLLTGLPVPYTLAPERLRNVVMGKKKREVNFSFNDKLPLDALRYLIVKSLERITHETPERKSWEGKRYVCLMTHDVDSREGLRRARRIVKLEEKYDVPSAWYIPSKRYKLDRAVLENLANHGEIGAHDTKHDGKLGQISENKLVRRLHDVKKTLEKIIGQPVKGFRAPLLQHNANILEALERVGYAYDSSVPTWEPNHPSSMGPCGVGTVYPLHTDGIVEIPVTLPQDHQMNQVLGLSAKQTVKKWLEMVYLIKKLEGVGTILVHPNHKIGHSRKSDIYEELLNSLISDNDILLTTPIWMVEQCC